VAKRSVGRHYRAIRGHPNRLLFNGGTPATGRWPATAASGTKRVRYLPGGSEGGRHSYQHASARVKEELQTRHTDAVTNATPASDERSESIGDGQCRSRRELDPDPEWDASWLNRIETWFGILPAARADPSRSVVMVGAGALLGDRDQLVPVEESADASSTARNRTGCTPGADHAHWKSEANDRQRASYYFREWHTLGLVSRCAPWNSARSQVRRSTAFRPGCCRLALITSFEVSPKPERRR
jgi:hypothetical protein